MQSVCLKEAKGGAQVGVSSVPYYWLGCLRVSEIF
uniref:Uncharacterized protein n=1 Tax=Arundo donax TaxID=35708 RepID=A0A0A9B049_ARUDO